MTKYFLREGESLEKVLKKFKRKLRKDGVLDDLRKKEFFVKPSEQKKGKLAAAKRRTFLSTLED